MIKFGRRAQEEIVGFVMIVLIVVIIFVILLGIFLRQDGPSERLDSSKAYQFLESALEHTTDCAINFEPSFSNVGDLIKECDSGSRCTSGETACEVLNSTLVELIDVSFELGPNADEKGIVFEAYYSSNFSRDDIIIVSRGECGDNFRGSDKPVVGKIKSSLKICN
jgi:hypothetical protein